MRTCHKEGFGDFFSWVYAQVVQVWWRLDEVDTWSYALASARRDMYRASARNFDIGSGGCKSNKSMTAKNGYSYS
jgi:hypothetical protein